MAYNWGQFDHEEPWYRDAGDACPDCNGHGYCPGADEFCASCQGTGEEQPREREEY